MSYKPIAPRIVCADGTSLSVQASSLHYSTPREDHGPYTHVEVGYIRWPDGRSMRPPDTWRQYADGDFPNDVYGHVPIGLVEAFIAEHGGRRA